MGNPTEKPIYYKGVRPTLGVRTRDQQGYNGFIDRNGRCTDNSFSIFADSHRGSEDNLFQESVLARLPLDNKWSDNQRDNHAFGDHDDTRHDWS